MLHVQCELQCFSCIPLAFRMHDEKVLQMEFAVAVVCGMHCWEGSHMQGFALLMRAQQILIAHLERLDHGGDAPQEAPLEETGPESILEQPLIKLFKVSVALCHLQVHKCRTRGFRCVSYAMCNIAEKGPLTAHCVLYSFCILD